MKSKKCDDLILEIGSLIVNSKKYEKYQWQGIAVVGDFSNGQKSISGYVYYDDDDFEGRSPGFDTLDKILEYCINVEKASVIGPTAGFLPDPLFERGIDVIGGTCVTTPQSLRYAIQNGIKWNDSVKKYTIEIKNYPGYKDLNL